AYRPLSWTPPHPVATPPLLHQQAQADVDDPQHRAHDHCDHHHDHRQVDDIIARRPDALPQLVDDVHHEPRTPAESPSAARCAFRRARRSWCLACHRALCPHSRSFLWLLEALSSQRAVHITILTHFAVLPVHPAARTELPQLYPVRIIPSVLLRGIRPLAALRACQVDYHTVLFLGHATPVPSSTHPRRPCVRPHGSRSARLPQAPRASSIPMSS